MRSPEALSMKGIGIKQRKPEADTAPVEGVAKAEETTEEVVDEVLGDENVKTEVPVSTTAEQPTLYDKYRAAFEMDGFDIK